MVRRVLATSLCALLLSQSASARADESESDRAAAEALFAEGRRLIAAGKPDEACPKFAGSQRLDPAPGTALNLAACYERIGKTASAWLAYRDAEAAAAMLGQKDRMARAKSRAALLEATLSMVTVVVSPAAAVTGLEIRRDGATLPQGAWGAALPVDPGAHELAATAPGKRHWAARVQVEPGASKLTVTIPRLDDDAVPTLPRAAATEEKPVVEHVSVVADAGKPRGQAQRVAGLAIGGVGLAGVAVGVVFGLKTISTYQNAKAACGGTTVCTTSDGLQLRGDVDTYSTISNIAFVAGGVLAAGGAILFFTAPKKTPSALGVTVSPRGPGAVLSMAGEW